MRKLYLACLFVVSNSIIIYAQNTNVGSGAGNSGSWNTSIGYYAGDKVTGSYNTFLGGYSGKNTSSGYNNTFLGKEVFRTNISGGYNSVVGSVAGYYSTGSYNVVMGYYSAYGLSGKSGGSYNTFLGTYSGRYNQGNYNSYIGYNAGVGRSDGTSTGGHNIGIGYYSGYSIKSGYDNVFLGRESGRYTNDGYSNTFIGASSGYNNSGGDNNTFVGRSSGYKNSTGNNNVAIGYQAGYDNYGLSGSGNVFIGYQAGYSVGGSNKLIIANNSSNSLISGDFSAQTLSFNGTATVTGNLTVNGTISASNLNNYYSSGSSPSFSTITSTDHIYGRSVNASYSNLYRFGGLYFTWDSDSYGTNTHHSIRSTYGDGYGDNITINSFNHIRFNIDANNNNSMSYFEVGHNTTGTGNILMRLQSDGKLGLGVTNPGYALDVSGDIKLTGNLKRGAHHTGHLEGSYNNIGSNSYKSNPIYTIGSNYNPADATIGDMYGVGYTHTNASFINSTDLGINPSGGWGWYAASDGNARVFLNAGNGDGFFRGRVYSEHLNARDEVVFSGLAASNQTRFVVSDSNGKLFYRLESSFGDNLGNHIATQNLNMNGKAITGLDLGGGGISGNNYNIGGVNELKISDSGEGINFHDKGNMYIVDDETDDKFYIGPGNVGIGLTPSYKLDVDGDIRANSGWIRSTGDYGLYNNSDGTYFYSEDGSYWKMRSDRGLIMSNKANAIKGYLYHDNANSFGLLDGDGQWGLRLDKDNYTSFHINNSEKMRIKSDGNVGIGTSTPYEKLHINGSVRGGSSGGSLRISTGNGYVDIGPQNSSWSHFYTDRARFYFNKGVTVDEGLIGSYDENLQLQTSGSTRLTLSNSNGDATFTGNILASGGTSPQWTDVYTKVVTNNLAGSGLSWSGTKLSVNAGAGSYWTKTSNDLNYSAGNVEIGQKLILPANNIDAGDHNDKKLLFSDAVTGEVIHRDLDSVTPWVIREIGENTHIWTCDPELGVECTCPEIVVQIETFDINGNLILGENAYIDDDETVGDGDANGPGPDDWLRFANHLELNSKSNTHGVKILDNASNLNYLNLFQKGNESFLSNSLSNDQYFLKATDKNITTGGNLTVNGTILATGYNPANWDEAHIQRGSQIAGNVLSWDGTALNLDFNSVDFLVNGSNQLELAEGAGSFFTKKAASEDLEYLSGSIYTLDGNSVDWQATTDLVGLNAANWTTAYNESLSNISLSGLDWNGSSLSVQEGAGSYFTKIGDRLVYDDGKLLINTDVIPPNYTMAVGGDVVVNKLWVRKVGQWFDNVFEEDYDLQSLEEVESYIKENKHLPDVPPESKVKEEGIDLARMNALLLKKIEELTLHMIEIKKESDEQRELITKLMEKEASK